MKFKKLLASPSIISSNIILSFIYSILTFEGKKQDQFINYYNYFE